jgi:hypothetical protein
MVVSVFLFAQKIHWRSAGHKEGRIGFFQIRTINLPAQINYLWVPVMAAAPLLERIIVILSQRPQCRKRKNPSLPPTE